MIRSMTGFGEVQRETAAGIVSRRRQLVCADRKAVLSYPRFSLMQRQDESVPPFIRFEVNNPTVSFHNLLHDKKAQAGPPDFIRTGQARKFLKQELLLCLVYRWPFIKKSYDDSIVPMRRFYPDGAAFVTILKGIAQ